MGQTTSSTPTPAAAPQPTKAPAQCPVQHDSSSSRPGCPIAHDTPLDPSNQIPKLAQSPSPNQTAHLPTARATSSIPRGDGRGESVWEYPSPQQFYNALVRKGWETPEEHVETMVEIHDFLNEMAWKEVLKWENRVEKNEGVQLARFKGRPGEHSPKARLFMLLGQILPSRFNTEPPFDRHDWIVRRPKTGEEVRYVIDYYSAAPSPDGAPVFSLDVRPALDNLGSVKERISVATEELWASLREK